MADTSLKLFQIKVPEQGFYEDFGSATEVGAWLVRQTQFWDSFNELMDSGFDMGPLGSTDTSRALRDIVSKWQEWTNQASSGSDGAIAALASIQELAGSINIIIPDGHIGKRLRQMLDRGNADDLKFAILAFNLGVLRLPGAFNVVARAVKSVAALHPVMEGARDVETARHLLTIAEDASAEMSAKREKLDSWIAGREISIEKLSHRFRNELPYEKPAVHWRRAATTNYILVGLFLVAFSALVLGPVILVMEYWPQIAPFVQNLLSSTGSSIPFGPITLLLVPIIGYGWLLKHISRLFVQSYALAVDALHRRSLAITYLGLVDYEKTQLADAERAIILNALFRPPPPYGSDDGPPMGLVDLIKK